MPVPNESAGLILLVEDNRPIAEMVIEYLERRGFEVDYASDGLEGYRLAHDNSYDAIVLDLMLPRMDGVAVCRKLRDEAKKATPRSEEHTSELQSLMRISYAVFCLKKKITKTRECNVEHKV